MRIGVLKGESSATYGITVKGNDYNNLTVLILPIVYVFNLIFYTRRGPAEPDRYRDKDYEKRERMQEIRYSSER